MRRRMYSAVVHDAPVGRRPAALRAPGWPHVLGTGGLIGGPGAVLFLLLLHFVTAVVADVVARVFAVALVFCLSHRVGSVILDDRDGNAELFVKVRRGLNRMGELFVGGL